MSQRFMRFILFLSLAVLLAASPAAVFAQEPEPTASPSLSPTAGETAEQSQEPYARPLLTVSSYSYGDPIMPGSDFTLNFVLENQGEADATNIVVTFDGGTDFIPKGTGGVIALPFIDTHDSESASQSFLAASSLLGNKVWILPVNISYTDYSGASYSGTFNLSIDLMQWSYSAAVPTVTPTPSGRAQLVVGGYKSSVDPLQPGSMFELQLDVVNLGQKNAQAVTMVLGGGSLPPGNGEGTPAPGGISGGSGDTSVFAPIGQSNVVFMGDLAAGERKTTANQLIVNVTAAPGAYPLKISFLYTDEKNQRIVEDQVITLLVYRLPQVGVSFYTEPGLFFTGQPGPLPIQVNNLGRSTAVLGNMRVTSEAGEVMNGTTLVGTLEPGGYFPLDAMFTPFQAGPAELLVTISYTDDFNQPREITQTLSVQVEEGGMIDPGMVDPGMVDPGMDPGLNPGGGPGTNSSETFWQKVVRFVRGLLGIGSGVETPADGMPGEFPSEPMPGEEVQPGPRPAVPGKG